MIHLKSALLILLVVIANPVFAKAHSGGGHSGGGSHASHTSHVSSSRASAKAHNGTRAKRSASRSSTSHVSSGHRSSKAAAGVKRDSHGKIARSQKAKDEFKKQHPCPATGKSTGACKGYVVDHITPLKRGGADAPSNLQWQTKEAAKAKDKWE